MPNTNPPPDGHSAAPDNSERKYPSQDTEGLQHSGGRRSLVWPMVIVIVCAAGGAVLKYLRTDESGDERVEAVLFGAAMGLAVGAIASGYLVAFTSPPQPARLLTLSEFRDQHRWARRRLFVVVVAWASAPLLLVVLSRFGHDSSGLSAVMCFGSAVVACGLCAYSRGLAWQLCDWKCPQCREPFGNTRGHCHRCGMSMRDSAGKSA